MGENKVQFSQGDNGTYLATLNGGTSQWVLPPGWQPSRIACSRVTDAMLALVEPRDREAVPVGEVFGLVSTVAADIIRQMATAKAEASKAQGAMVEAQQKLLVESKESDATIQALIRALYLATMETIEVAKIPAIDPTEHVVGLVRDAIDQMAAKPRDVASLVKEIREAGKLWQK